MSEAPVEIKDLLARLEELSKKQLDLQLDMSTQGDEINRLKIEFRRQVDLRDAESPASVHQ